VEDGFAGYALSTPGEIRFLAAKDCDVNTMLDEVRATIGRAVPGDDISWLKPEQQYPAWIVGLETKTFIKRPGIGNTYPLTEEMLRRMLDWPGHRKYITREQVERAEKLGVSPYELPEVKELMECVG